METKVIPKPTTSTPLQPLPEVLGTLITLVQQECDISNLDELARVLNKKFNVVVSVNTLINYYTPAICIEESKLQYEQYGYNEPLLQSLSEM
jgi:hypothetical protein